MALRGQCTSMVDELLEAETVLVDQFEVNGVRSRACLKMREMFESTHISYQIPLYPALFYRVPL